VRGDVVIIDRLIDQLSHRDEGVDRFGARGRFGE